MSQAPLRYAVVLTDVEGLRPSMLARALAPLKKVPVQDLLVGLRSSWGVIDTDLDEPAARQRAQALTSAGCAALAIPVSLLEDPPPARLVEELAEPLKPVLLAAAVFTIKEVKTVQEQQGPSAQERAVKLGLSLATGIPFGLGSGKKTVERKVVTSDLAYFLDIYFGEPLARIRIDGQRFDYSILKDKMGYDAGGNFRRMIEALAPTSKRLNRGASGLLAGKAVREFGYESLTDLDREARWLLTLEALKR